MAVSYLKKKYLKTIKKRNNRTAFFNLRDSLIKKKKIISWIITKNKHCESNQNPNIQSFDHSPESISPSSKKPNLQVSFSSSIQTEHKPKNPIELSSIAQPVFSKQLESSNQHSQFVSKKKNKRKKNKFGKNNKKYWVQRYRLFSKFDEGIRMDKESWYSVTPEIIATHIAQKFIDFDVIVDPFCGVGGNTIQFAKRAKKVIAIDLDPYKLQCAQHNAKIYKVLDKIEFIKGNFFDLYKEIKGDAVFLSPPWGGPSYIQQDIYDLITDMPLNGLKIFQCAQEISPNIAYYVPRNSKLSQLVAFSGSDCYCEIEENYINMKLKTITCYYGSLIKDQS